LYKYILWRNVKIKFILSTIFTHIQSISNIQIFHHQSNRCCCCCCCCCCCFGLWKGCKRLGNRRNDSPRSSDVSWLELASWTKCRHPWKASGSYFHHVSISSTFYVRIFCTKVCSKTNFEQRKDFRTKNACVKCEWN